MVVEQLQGILNDTWVHDGFQSGFKVGFGTALIALVDNIWLQLDNSRCVLLILLDLSAVFNTVDHLVRGTTL